MDNQKKTTGAVSEESLDGADAPEAKLEANSSPTPLALETSPDEPQPTPSDEKPKSGANAPAQMPKSSKNSLLGRVKNFRYLYFVIYGLLLLLIAGLTLTSLRSKPSTPTGTKTASLTANQLAQLEASTTVVGDSKQTLDIQGNSIFEGQVLARNDLSVAGGLKVGGALSLPTLSVGGQGSFGQLQVSGTASVTGDTTLSGQLTVQKSLTVAGSGSFSGSLSAASLNVGSLQFNGDIVISRHLALTGAVPTKVDGTAIGSGGTTSVNGTDTAGTITINTGNSPPAGNLITVNFATAFKSTPHVVVTPVGSAAAGLNYYVSRSTTNFTIATTNAPPGGSSFSFDYIVID